MTHRVVIIGGGFGGLHAAKKLKDPAIAVTLIDRRNFHLFQPLLYQVATGGLSPANIASPLRAILRKQKNVDIVLGEAIDIDCVQKQVVLRDRRISYDSLIVASGAHHDYFGHPQWEPFAPGLKTVEDATEIRRRILSALETAELSTDDDLIARCLTFVVVGGGPTGVELAGALGELTRRTLRDNFRRIDASSAKILLIEGEDRVLPMYSPDLSETAKQSLQRLGVSVLCNARVTEVNAKGVQVQFADATQEIPAKTVLWGAGVRASRLGKVIAESTNAQLDRSGRVIVESDCTISDHREMFVIGDLAAFEDERRNQLPGVAPVAIQQGRYVAGLIRDRLNGKATKPFVYRDHGKMSTIGRAAAVAEIGSWHLTGFVAWVAWLLVHLMQLVGFENRVLVLIQWAGNYFTRNRAARLITQTENAGGND
ncbi:NADH dehydrogenase-like protein [Novipirellula aureliae]|uniref:NADH:ubiquinone reductase (non-electrogenic) n=1 Tax=Novipirellula aureliae TaxID=2527966 RepID=A0A5C6EBP9_9BACT|nr:NAD(P)/FAD-dependent oxidoreductase [Novipirellula aureliae]TWU45844.1 NADH dehydrogenase-like protein [Novipirellula aureliae]